ncbi:MAG TPA: MFS transporter [Pirellulales bacterium]|jgi:MFS family permease
MSSLPIGAKELPFGMSPARYKWFVVGILWFICFFNYADRQAIFSIKTLLTAEFGFNDEDLGWIDSAFMIVYALTASIAGQVGDRNSRKLVIMAGLYVWSAVTGFTALCTGFWGFVTVRAAEGLGETFYFPASMSLVSDYHGKSTRSRAMSLHQTSVYAGIIGGGSLAAYLGQHFGWRTPFVFLGISGILLGLLLGLFLREPIRNQAEISESEARDATRMLSGGISKPKDTAPKTSFWRFLLDFARTPSAVVLLITFPCVNFVAWVVISWMPKYLSTHFKLSITEAGFNGTAWLQIGSLAGVLFGGWLADFWRLRMAGGRMSTQAVGLLLGAPFVYVCGTTNDLKVIILMMTLFGLFKGIYDSNIWAALYDVVPTARRSSAVGLMNTIGWAGAAAGPISVGAGVTRGYFTFGQAFAATGAIYLALGLLLMFSAFFLAPRDVRRVAAEQAALNG